MSAKFYCDCCGVEITTANDLRGSSGPHPVSGWRLGGKSGRLSVEVMTAIDGTWNGGNVCKHCVIDAVLKLDDRPAAQEVPQEVVRDAMRYRWLQAQVDYGPLALCEPAMGEPYRWSPIALYCDEFVDRALASPAAPEE